MNTLETLSWAEHHLASLAESDCPISLKDQRFELRRVALAIGALHDKLQAEQEEQRPLNQRELEMFGNVVRLRPAKKEQAA